MALEHFKTAWAETKSKEKGYSNHPSDPGGETNHGITIRVARAHGFMGAMRALQPETAEFIAKLEYWDRYNLDAVANVSPKVAYELFDTAFNMWAGAAGKFLQRALNSLNKKGTIFPDLAVDGRIGSQTIDAMHKYFNHRRSTPVDAEKVLLMVLNAQQCKDYMDQCIENPNKEDFFYGWILNRVQL